MPRRPPDFMDPRETFEKYERRSPSASMNQSFSSTHQPRPSPSSYHPEFGQLACEYRAPPTAHTAQSYHQPRQQQYYPQQDLACEYRAAPQDHMYTQKQDLGQLEYRDSPSVNVTSYMPEKRKVPIFWVVCLAVSVPLFIIICLFGAVWLQELGML